MCAHVCDVHVMSPHAHAQPSVFAGSVESSVRKRVGLASCFGKGGLSIYVPGSQNQYWHII